MKIACAQVLARAVEVESAVGEVLAGIVGKVWDERTNIEAETGLSSTT